MADKFIGLIIPFAGKVPPKGWAFCDGQLLSTKQYSAVFAILGIMYGGDGRDTFALPNLEGRTPIHPNDRIPYSTAGGSPTKQLTVSHLPAHSHTTTVELRANTAAGNTNNPVGAYPANTGARDPEYAAVADTEMAADSIQATSSLSGSGEPFSNMQPYLAMHFIISLTGDFPHKD